MFPRSDLSYTGNFLRMMFGTPLSEFQEKKILTRALDRILFYMQTTSKTPLRPPLGFVGPLGPVHTLR